MKTTLIFSAIIIVSSWMTVNAQDSTIMGKVVDSKGSVLTSTLVLLKSDASYHAISDKNGQYVLNFTSTKKDTLLFLSGGYENREIAINNQQTINAILNESKVKDNDVIVVAYSAINKKKADPTKIPNAYDGDNSVEIPNGYDSEKDISVEIPNADLKGKKTIIRKLTPELLPNP